MTDNETSRYDTWTVLLFSMFLSIAIISIIYAIVKVKGPKRQSSLIIQEVETNFKGTKVKYVNQNKKVKNDKKVDLI